ncbi:MAG TPA: FixH family protein [Patescibacteria group bacterium]|nr:FixH family protein [Patescibacteria group bacterium]
MKNSGKSWAIGIVTLYTSFALLTLGFVYFAIGQNYDLVSKDYYEQTVEFQSQIDRESRTNAIAENVTCSLSADKQNVEIAIPNAAQVNGKVTLYRPSEADLDKHFFLALDGNGRQNIPVQGLLKGKWKMKVLWTAGGEEFYKECEIFL